MVSPGIEESAMTNSAAHTAPGAEVPHISVCVCTFKRAALLANLLKGLYEQRTEGQFTFSIVIVDNDCAGTARETVERFQVDHDIAIDYFIEPEQSIALARNRAVGNAKGD